MRHRSFCRAAIFAALLFAPASRAQITPVEANAVGASLRAERKEDGFHSVPSQPLRSGDRLKQSELPPVRFHRARFIVLSAALYTASAADMHQTLHNRKYSWWYEADPLARPFVRLPAPAYYVAGLTLATGINWMSWKMGHSRRWHKLAPIPQLLSIAGNTYGFKSNHYQNY